MRISRWSDEPRSHGAQPSRLTMPAPTVVADDTGWGECAALLRDDFASFAARCFRELNSRTPFTANWHFELVAAKLAAVRQGQGS